MHDLNPYSPPGSASVVDAAPAHYGEASQRQRFANFLIDGFAYNVLAFVLGLLWGVVISPEVPAVTGYFIGWGALLAYYLGLEGTTGRTLGKLVTGTRVVSADGADVTFWRLLGRTFSRFVPFEPLSFLGQGPGWHDQWSRTLVVRVRRPRDHVDAEAG